MLDLGTDPDTTAEVDGPATLAELRDAARLVGRLVQRIDPDAVPLSHAARYWEACDYIARFGQNAATLLARRVDESDAWKKAGCPSPDAYRARQGGTGLGDARRQGDASRRLDELPDTRDAMRNGELSATRSR